jgi:hypothetical protein
MFRPIRISIFLSLLCIPVLWVLTPGKVSAFPLRIDEDCFYGEGVPTGDGLSTWMGYAVEFTPPYTPYTVDSISIFIADMRLMPDADPTLVVSIIDGDGILWQKTYIKWRNLEGHQGWVMIDLADHEYNGKFIIIIHSGIEIPGSTYVQESPDAVNGSSTLSKLISTSIQSPLAQNFPGGNWMIRAEAPGLVTESTHVYITMDDIEALHTPPDIPQPEWHLPPIERIGPRGIVRCPTSLAGITFYYYESDRSKKFLTPHDGPWANSSLIQTLAAMCEEMYREGIIGIEHIGIYNDRNIYGTNVKSSHAYGLGIDISGFQYSDGRTYFVEDHDDPEVRAVLEHIRDDYLKKYFPTVLDWHYQRHNNHFHVNLPYPE